MNRSTFKHILYSLVLTALLLSVVAPASVAPAATPVPSLAPPPAATLPEAPPPPGGAVRFTPQSAPPDLALAPPAPAPEAPEVEEASPAAPAAPDSPDGCSNPAAGQVTFGQDLELTLGPIHNNTTTKLEQSRAWTTLAEVSHIGPDTSGNDCSGSGPQPEEVYIYGQTGFGGACAILTPGLYNAASTDFEDVGGENTESIKVGRNVEVTLWRYQNYTGSSRTFAPGSEVSDLGVQGGSCSSTLCRNQASSGKVWLKPHAAGNVSLAALGTDSNIVLIKTLNSDGAYGDVASISWDAHSGWGWLTREGLSADGNPIVVVRGHDLAYFVRSDTNIKFKMQTAGTWGTWANLPGISGVPVIADAASDPVVVAPDINHIKLLYRTSGGEVKLLDWEPALGWRSAALSLGTPAGTTISELNATARDENHLDVFGVGADKTLYVRHWSIENRPDWSDTSWTALMTGVKIAKPALTSRYTGHIGVLVLADTTNVPMYKEWTAARYEANQGSPRGWKNAVSLAGSLDTVNLMGTYSDEMMAIGVNSAGSASSKWWTESGTSGAWSGWGSHGSGWATGQILAAIAGRPHDLMFIGRNTDNELAYKRATNAGMGITATSLANPGAGTLRAQAIATVNAKTYWASVYRNNVGKWTLEVRNTSAWGTAYTLDLSDAHPNNTTDVDTVAVAVGDLDKNGDDEIIVVTIRPDAQAWVTTGYKVVPSSSTPLQRLWNTSRSMSGSVTDVNVAVGDLDGDGFENDVAVVARYGGENRVRLMTFRGYFDTLTQGQNVNIDGPGGDLELAIGQVDGNPGEQVVLATYKLGSAPQIITYKYDPLVDTSNVTQRYILTGPVYSIGGATGSYSSAIATGDIDSDGRDEVVYTYGDQIYAISVEVAIWLTAPHYAVADSDAGRSLAVGDVDGDGRAEIVYNRSNDTGWTALFKLMDPWASTDLDNFGSAPNTLGVPLLADLDGDSHVATYRDCQEISDLRVVGVVNSFPVYYQDGIPVQDTAGGMANSTGSGSSKTDGWKATMGGSIAFGFEHEWNTPILAIKLGEVSVKAEQEFSGSWGGGKETVNSITEEDGFSYGGGAFSQGGVCYTKTSYKCYRYDVGPANSPYTTTAQACAPVQPPPDAQRQFCDSLEDWYSMNPQIGIRQAAGESWAPVGHHTTTSGLNVVSVNVAEYPILTAPPVDPYLIWWKKATRIDVGATTNPGGGTPGWAVEKGEGESTFKSSGFESKTTVSGGFKAADFTFEASYFGGKAFEWSTGVSWETAINFSGEVNNYPAASGIVSWNNTPPCPIDVCTEPYAVVPFVYQATAHTLGGLTYSYLEQDYYKAANSMASGAAVQEVAQIVGLTPAAPVISSTTHPNEDTWYPANTVTFNWSQLAGDPAHVIGYRWNLNHTPVATPTAMVDVTTTQTYHGLADGVYYVHIQAVGDTGERGPVTHRQVRVDTGAPQVKFVSDPGVPDGSNGWYNTPMTFTVTAADPNGSGVKSIETSADGTIWQSYAPIHVTADTPGATFWARATDNLGQVSAPVSTTIKLDQTPPSVRDSDRYGLSYANIITDEVGNMQLVLGGALSDALSGRLQAQVKAGETGEWNTVSAVGDLPIPPGNWFTTTMTSLQWIYTPTFEIRGAYPLYVRGMDVAGNVGYYYSNTFIMPGGCFWWDPVAEPALDESRVSVWPHQARPGDVVAFTVAARNSGYQEAQMLITDTVPVGLTVLPGSISDGGQYDASTRQIAWTLHALWPGQTRYLFFKATADSTATTTALENQLDLMAYWPWDRSCDPRVPPEPTRHYYSTSATLTVMPGAAMRASAAAATSNPTAPRIMNAAVVEGEVAGDPNVTLLVNANPEVRSLYVKEWTWNGALNMWSLAQESGWVPFEAAAGLAVSQDAIGKYGRYDWTLSEGDGVKYLGIWVADADGQISNLSEGNLIYTNLVSAGGQQLTAGQGAQYRVQMRAGQLAVLALVSLSGDADLYVWKPRAGLKPHYYSNAVPTGSGLSLDSVGFYAGEEGMYVIEVQAVTDAHYRLVTAGDVSSAAAGLAETQGEDLPASTHLALAEKERPAHPVTLTTPFSVGGIELLPQAARIFKCYFPLIFHQ